MLLLHLSDLHFGNNNRFGDDDPEELGKAFAQSLEEARSREELLNEEKVSLVIVTGDFAELGLPSEFKKSRQFLEALANALELPREKFVLLPGNHDISWPACRIARGELANEAIELSAFEENLYSVKLANYREFVSEFYGRPNAEASNTQDLGNGGWLHEFPECGLSVAALNTSEREHDELKGGYLSEGQAQNLMEAWKEKTDGFRIIALHHNPIANTAGNRKWVEKWRRNQEEESESTLTMTADVFEHYCADLAGFEGNEHLSKIVADTSVHLVLHGHHHDQGTPTNWNWETDGSAPVLSVGSLGLEEDQLPGSAPLSCQFIRFATTVTPKRLIAVPLVYDAQFRLKGNVLEGAFRKEERKIPRILQPTPSWGWFRQR